jgi:hypothetical protein
VKSATKETAKDVTAAAKEKAGEMKQAAKEIAKDIKTAAQTSPTVERMKGAAAQTAVAAKETVQVRSTPSRSRELLLVFFFFFVSSLFHGGISS